MRCCWCDLEIVKRTPPGNWVTTYARASRPWHCTGLLGINGHAPNFSAIPVAIGELALIEAELR